MLLLVLRDRERRLGIRLLTRTFRLLQVVHPLELPGIPTMLGRRACLASHCGISIRKVIKIKVVTEEVGKTLDA